MQTEIDELSSTLLGKMQLFLDEDIKYLNGSSNTLDGKYFSGKGIKILRNKVSANVRGNFLYVPPTAYTSQHIAGIEDRIAVLQLFTLH